MEMNSINCEEQQQEGEDKFTAKLTQSRTQNNPGRKRANIWI
jgi:hypothetical protein